MGPGKGREDPGGVLWITGRPASGKTTLARALVREFESRGRRSVLLDSDEVRAVVTPEARYTPEERELFYRFLAYTAARLAESGAIAVVAATAHDAAYRRWAKSILPNVFLVYARCPLEVCEARDPKGLYRQARSDPDMALPGVGVAYVEPRDADYIMETDQPLAAEAIAALAEKFLSRLK